MITVLRVSAAVDNYFKLIIPATDILKTLARGSVFLVLVWGVNVCLCRRKMIQPLTLVPPTLRFG